MNPTPTPRPRFPLVGRAVLLLTLTLAALLVTIPAAAAFLSVIVVFLGDDPGGADPTHLLDGARGVAVGNGEDNVYIAAEDADEIMIYSRSGASFTPDKSAGRTDVRDVDAHDLLAWSTRGFIQSVTASQILGSGQLGTSLSAAGAESAVQRIVARKVDPIVNAADSYYHAYTTAGFGIGTAVVRAFRATVSGGVLQSVVAWDYSSSFFGPTDAWGLALDPTAEHLYVTSPSDDTVSLLYIDLSDARFTGSAATYDQTDWVGCVSCLNTARSVEVSPDGNHVYVGGLGQIAVFDRNTSTGALTYASEALPGGSDVHGLAITSDGKYLAAADPAGDRVFVYSRDLGTGALTEEAVISNSDLTAGGLDGVTDLTFQPDSGLLYAVSTVGDGTGFGGFVVIDLALFIDGFEIGDTSAWV